MVRGPAPTTCTASTVLVQPGMARQSAVGGGGAISFGMQIRVAQTADHPLLAAMRYDFRAAVEAPNEPRDVFEARTALWLESHLGRGWKAWLACEAEAVIGQVFLHVIDKVPNPVPEPEQLGYVTNLYVRADCRGRGVGAALLDVALDECRALGLDTVVLWPSERSKSLYERRGFRAPAEVLELPLSDHPGRRGDSARLGGRARP